MMINAPHFSTRKDHSKRTPTSYCLNCKQIYYQNRAKYNQKTHSFVCPNCGK